MKKQLIILSLSLCCIGLNAENYLIKLENKHIQGYVVEEITYVDGWSGTGVNQETGTLYDSDGWTKDGINEETGTEYNVAGYNSAGYDDQGLGVLYSPQFENKMRAQGTATVSDLIIGFEYRSGGTNPSSTAFYGGRIRFSYTNESNLSEEFIKENFPSSISFYSLTSYQERTFTDTNGQKYIIRTLGNSKTTSWYSQSVWTHTHQGAVTIQKVL